MSRRTIAALILAGLLLFGAGAGTAIAVTSHRITGYFGKAWYQTKNGPALFAVKCESAPVTGSAHHIYTFGTPGDTCAKV